MNEGDKTMSQLQRIREQLTGGASLSDILLNTLALASELDNAELRNWARFELDSYPDDVELPAYRKLDTLLFGNFYGGFMQVSGQQIPISLLPENVRDDFRTMRVNVGVAALEEMAASEDSDLHFPVPAETASYFNGKMINKMAACTGAYRLVGRGQIAQVLISIKTRLLDFILEMEKTYPALKASHVPSAEVSAAASQMIQTTIYGGYNVVAAGHGFTQNAPQQVSQGDMCSLRASLQQLGASEADLKDLEDALNADGQPAEPKKLGARVRAWFGGMCQKALDGALKVSVDAAPAVIDKALSHYYGWS